MHQKSQLETLTVADIWDLLVPNPTTLEPDAAMVDLLRYESNRLIGQVNMVEVIEACLRLREQPESV